MAHPATRTIPAPDPLVVLACIEAQARHPSSRGLR